MANGFVDFNTLYGLAGNEMERIDNEALQRELAKVEAAQQQAGDQVNFNFLDSAHIGSDPRKANLEEIEKNYSGGYETLKTTGSYSDFMKAQEEFETRANQLASKEAKMGRFGSLRNAYGDDTMAAKVASQDAATMADLLGKDERFSAEVDRKAEMQKQGRENAINARKGYVDDYNARYDAARNAYISDQKRNKALSSVDTSYMHKLYKNKSTNDFIDILNEGGANLQKTGSGNYIANDYGKSLNPDLQSIDKRMKY